MLSKPLSKNIGYIYKKTKHLSSDELRELIISGDEWLEEIIKESREELT